MDYQASGSVSITTPAWAVSAPPIYSTTVFLTKPFQPPPGYGFEVYLMSSSSYTYVSTARSGTGTSELVVRITQFHSAAQLTITLGWRLTKIG